MIRTSVALASTSALHIRLQIQEYGYGFHESAQVWGTFFGHKNAEHYYTLVPFTVYLNTLCARFNVVEMSTAASKLGQPPEIPLGGAALLKEKNDWAEIMCPLRQFDLFISDAVRLFKNGTRY